MALSIALSYQAGARGLAGSGVKSCRSHGPEKTRTPVGRPTGDRLWVVTRPSYCATEPLSHRATEPPNSRRAPEPAQRPHVRAVAELLEGPLADLADALAGDAEEGADLFEGEGLRAFLETVVQGENLAFARGEMALEELIDELPLKA